VGLVVSWGRRPVDEDVGGAVESAWHRLAASGRRLLAERLIAAPPERNALAVEAEAGRGEAAANRTAGVAVMRIGAAVPVIGGNDG